MDDILGNWLNIIQLVNKYIDIDNRPLLGTEKVKAKKITNTQQ